MANSNEEKVKEIFSDKEKVEAFINDEEFMSKVSGGNAEPQDYVNKFKDFGVELSIDEAKETSASVGRLLSGAPEKMSESELKDIAGGARVGVFVPAGGPLIAGLGCSIASCVYYSKAKKARKYDNEKYKKYIKKAENCGIATAALVGSSILLGSGAVVVTD